MIIGGDGYDMWNDFLNRNRMGRRDKNGITVRQLREKFRENKFDSPDGHFGLLEHSENQTFGAWEKGFFDEDEFADIDLSKEFKRELVDLRDEKRELLKNRKVLTDMHLMNIDPGSNTLSTKVDLNPFVEGKSTLSLDVVPRMAELLYEEGGRALGFDPQVNEDLNIWSKRTANDILENVAANSQVELSDEQKERVKRTGAYQVFEGVTRFAPAIAEFALIDVALKNIGAITGVPKLIKNIGKTYQMGNKGKAIPAWKIANQIGYKGSLRSDDFGLAIQRYNNSARKAKQVRNVIKVNDAPFFSTQFAMNHGYHILREEAKMRIAFEDDYKIGMGAGFYIAGASLPRFQFGRSALRKPSGFWDRTAGILNGSMKLGRSGIAGATGSYAAGHLEGMIEDIRGGTTYEKYLIEHYPDFSEQTKTGLVDFFTFMIAARGKGVSKYNFKSVSKLDKIEAESARIIHQLEKQQGTKDKPNGYGLWKSDPKAWEKKYNKYNDIKNGVTQALNEIDYNSKWEDKSTRRKIVERAATNAQDVFRNIEGMEDVKIEIHENNKKFQNKDGLAEITKDGKTIRLDLENITPESLPHEIGHMTLKALFKGNPEMSKAFANEIKSAFTNQKIGLFDVLDNKGKRTGEKRNMNLEEYIENEYRQRGDYKSIKSEEFVAYAIEMLVNPKYYSKLVGGGVFSGLKRNINRFYNQKSGKDLFKETDTKKSLINFLTNFGTSIQKGALTMNQITMFEKFGLKLAGKNNIDVTKLYEEQIDRDSRTESEKTTDAAEKSSPTKGLKRENIENIYTTKIAKLSGDEKRKAIEDFLMGKSAKKGTEAYEFEIRKQNPTANDAKIKELIEKGKPRIRTEAHFDAIAMKAVQKLYPDLPFAEQKSLINEIKYDPFKVSKTGKDVRKRGIVDIIMDYKPGKNKDLASWVMGNLMGAPETGGFSRVHEIKGERAGKLELEIPGLFRKSITEEEGAGVKEKELGSTTQEKQTTREKAPYTGKKIKIAEELKIEERDVESTKRVAGEYIEQAKLKDLTYDKIGNEILPVARPVIEKVFKRDAKFYKKLKENGLKDPYVQKVIKENRKDLFDNAFTLFHSIPKQMSKMAAEVTGAMGKFGPLYSPTGKRLQWSQMPTWMELSRSKKAQGPPIFEKKKFFNEADLKRAFLDFMYTNPKTGKPLRTEQVNTRIENLIDFATKSFGVQTAKDLVGTSGYREMILQKEGAAASIGREKIMELDKQKLIDKVEAQVRDALPQALATKGFKNRDGKYVDIEQRFLGLAKYTDLKSDQIIDLLSKEFPRLKEFDLEGLKNVDLTGYKVEGIMQRFMEAGRTFEDMSFELPMGPGGLELFPGGAVGKKQYSWNDAILREVKSLFKNTEGLDLRSGTTKLKDAQHAIDFYIGSKEGGPSFMARLAKKLGSDVVAQDFFRYMMGEQVKGVTPDFGKYEYRFEKYKTNAEGKIIKNKDGNPKKGDLIKVDNFDLIPKKFQNPLTKKSGVGFRLQALDAATSKSLVEGFLEGVSKKSSLNLKDVKITDNSDFLQYWNDFVTMVETKGLTGKALSKAVREFANDKLSANGDYIATKKANKDLLEHISNGIREVYSDYVKEGKAIQGLNLMHTLYQIQTSNGKGPFRGLATHKSGTLEKGVGMEFTKGGKLKSPGKFYRSEHFFQNVNLTGNNIIGTIKYHDNPTKFKEIHKTASDLFGQAGIAKRHQLIVDKDGNTTNIIEKKGLGSKSLGEFNIFNDRIAIEKTVDFASGKTFAEIMYPEIYKIEVYKKLKKLVEKNPILRTNEKLTHSELAKRARIADKALEMGRAMPTKGLDKKTGRKKARGMSTFDFDETLIIKGKNFITAIEPNTGRKIKISSGNWPLEGPKFAEQGYTFDFKDFVNVRGGVEGPLLQKMKNQIAKYGTENVFVLTARMQESAPAIYGWLKSKGVEIPFENITGLGNSTGNAKAMWMLEKFAEGYNDMYFVDDALPNVKAVKSVLDQLDIKSKVQQALPTKGLLDKNINDMMEYSLDIESGKRFSKAEAKVRGKDIKRRRIFMSDSASDLELLIEPLYGKGKKGIENKKWLEKEFIRPFERGINDYNKGRQAVKNDYMSLRKQNKDVVKIISKEVKGTSFTNDMAMRVYLWNKAGYKIPDLAKTTETKLVEHIKNNPKLQAYAEKFARITKQDKGLKEPSTNWWAETMAGEITNINRGVSRKQYLQDWIERKDVIFSEENLNKMESKFGTRWRENIEDMFDRMATGRTRSVNLDRGSNMMISYLNGSAGTIMNFNTRSAFLQTISTLNFLNMRENNPIAAARAMGNIPQFSRDFLKIINSDMLRQRRDGLEINVTEAEIASAAASSKNPIQSIIAKVLKVGYTPTKLADSFAIAFGGAPYYRNRVKMYKKQGMSTKEAEQKAWTDFQMLSERTQQSSRPDLLSKQQTTVVGRIVLPFANTPMQMNRRGMKEILDISKGRYKNTTELAEKMGRVTYYMGAQVALFAGLQSALFAMLFNDEDVTEDQIAKAKSYTMGTMVDSFLRGMGIRGSVIAGFKNAVGEFFKQQKKGWNADYSEVTEDLLNISPLVGSRYGRLDWTGDKIKFNPDVPFRFELGNPKLEATLLTVEALTNAPVYSPYQNAVNIQHGLNSDYEIWQRTHMFGGWSPFNVGIMDKKKEKSKTSKFQSKDFSSGGKKFQEKSF
jgi:hypothetical protein